MSIELSLLRAYKWNVPINQDALRIFAHPEENAALQHGNRYSAWHSALADQFSRWRKNRD
ncbi:hypothetical protein [Mesorhizobium sp. Mes31]|uniref:hypothetical protein n=1 Tax=Mesorhizobium sp. Mes31 TaxID=2926017 RepID=UPI00211776A4|nr:hypothetical protein [Mesorhizobium sp. Mes31]